MSKKATLISSEEGDWEILELDDGYSVEGHSLSSVHILDILEHLGYITEQKELSEDEILGI